MATDVQQLEKSCGKINMFTHDPNKAWDRLKVTQVIQPVIPIDPNTLIHPNKLRFVCLSDTHSRVEKLQNFVPYGDVLLHAGDFTCTGDLKSVAKFNKFLGSLPHKRKIVIAGNHELTFDPAIQRTRNYRVRSILNTHSEQTKVEGDPRNLLQHCIYLQDSYVKLCGIKIYGTPWQPEYCGWAFNLQRGVDLLEKWNMIPNDTDILITHSPPLGYGDLCASGIRAGCAELLMTIQTRVKPKYHVYGHIHEDYGALTDGKTVFINASNCTKSYLLANRPIVFDYPIPEGFSKSDLDRLPVIHEGSAMYC